LQQRQTEEEPTDGAKALPPTPPESVLSWAESADLQAPKPATISARDKAAQALLSLLSCPEPPVPASQVKAEEEEEYVDEERMLGVAKLMGLA
jgi:hypothetical protein